MTVLAVEAAPEIAEAAGGAAGSGAVEGRVLPRGGSPARPGTSSPARSRTSRTADPYRSSATVTPPGPRRRARPSATRQGQDIVIDTSPAAPAHNWHRWVMAEFIVCVVLAGASPFLSPGGKAGSLLAGVDKTDDIPAGVSLAKPLVRLTALCVLFFVLSLVATGEKSGKIAAAFGGLVTLGLAFNSLPEFVTVGAMFGSSKAAAKAVPQTTTPPGDVATDLGA